MRALRAAQRGRDANGNATRPTPSRPGLPWWRGVAVWRRAALRRGPEAPAVAPEPARLGWLPHWALEAVAPRRALCAVALRA